MLIERESEVRQHVMPTDPKPRLKATAVPVFRVHYSDLETYIRTVFGFDFDFLVATGGVNGLCPQYQVHGKLELDSVLRQANLIRKGQRIRAVDVILNTLAADGYIPTGNYTINTNKLPDPTNVYRELLLKHRNVTAPECLTFKSQFAHDKTFLQRAGVLERSLTEQTSAT